MQLRRILFSFSGRIPRQAFWLATLGTWGVSVAFVVLGTLVSVEVFGADKHKTGDTEAMLIVCPAMAFLLWTQAAVLAKRLHDTGRTGWWVPFSVIPIVALWLLVEAAFVRGKPGANKYGDDPLAGKV